MSASVPAVETVTLVGGLTVPLPALQLMWGLEERGIRLRVAPDIHGNELMAGPRHLLTDQDRAAMKEHRATLVEIVRYVETITPNMGM